VHFRSADGLLLDGHVAGTGARWVILSHMYRSDQSSWYGFAERLAARGLAALTYDFRGYGSSEGSTDVAHIDADVLGAIAYARSQGAGTIALMGASMGGTASLVAATEAPAGTPLRSIVTLSAPAVFMGLDAADVAAQVAVPVLCVAGAGDAGGLNAADARRLCTTPEGRPRRDADLVSTNSHGTALLDDPAASAAIDAAVDLLVTSTG